MKRTTFSLPDDLNAALEREARRRRRSRSEIAREALRAHLHVKTGERRVIPFAGIGRSGGGRPAAELEAELDETWADEIERDAFGGRGR
jgi:predicted transcriptional regulator